MNEKPILFQGDMIRAILEGQKTATRRIVKPTVKGCTVGVYTQDGKVSSVVNVQEDGDPWTDIKCPYGQVGNRLWVRETFKVGAWRDQGQLRIAFDYRASPELVNTPWCYPPSSEQYTNQILKAVHELDKKGIEPVGGGPDRIYKWEAGKSPLNWKPSIFMPRWASRITLEITEIKVERLQDMDNDNAINEGINKYWVNYEDGGGYWNVPACWKNPDGKIIKQIQTEDIIEAFANLWDSINKKRGYSWESNPWVWVINFRVVK